MQMPRMTTWEWIAPQPEERDGGGTSSSRSKAEARPAPERAPLAPAAAGV